MQKADDKKRFWFRHQHCAELETRNDVIISGGLAKVSD